VPNHKAEMFYVSRKGLPSGCASIDDVTLKYCILLALQVDRRVEQLYLNLVSNRSNR